MQPGGPWPLAGGCLGWTQTFPGLPSAGHAGKREAAAGANPGLLLELGTVAPETSWKRGGPQGGAHRGARLAGQVSTVVEQQRVQRALCPRPPWRERLWGRLLRVDLPGGGEDQARLGRTVHPTGAEPSQQSRGRALPPQGFPSSGLRLAPWEAELVFRPLVETQPLPGEPWLPHGHCLAECL